MTPGAMTFNTICCKLDRSPYMFWNLVSHSQAQCDATPPDGST
jgi:hypothetical protein